MPVCLFWRWLRNICSVFCALCCVSFCQSSFHFFKCLQIAAASLEKLFQHLTNPQIAYREDFIEVFLNTYPCFTTSRDVLTALFNCIRSPKEKTPDPTSSIQVSCTIY